MTVVLFPDRSTADAALQEIAATPDIEGGLGPVWVWYHPESSENAVRYGVAADGRVAIAHPWPEVDADWLAAYLAGWPGVQVVDALPPDWTWPDIP